MSNVWIRLQMFKSHFSICMVDIDLNAVANRNYDLFSILMHAFLHFLMYCSWNIHSLHRKLLIRKIFRLKDRVICLPVLLVCLTSTRITSRVRSTFITFTRIIIAYKIKAKISLELIAFCWYFFTNAFYKKKYQNRLKRTQTRFYITYLQLFKN